VRSEAPSSVRRIVTIDDAGGKSVAIHDGPTPDMRTDPARPGFAAMRIWVTALARYCEVVDVNSG